MESNSEAVRNNESLTEDVVNGENFASFPGVSPEWFERSGRTALTSAVMVTHTSEFAPLNFSGPSDSSKTNLLPIEKDENGHGGDEFETQPSRTLSVNSVDNAKRAVRLQPGVDITDDDILGTDLQYHCDFCHTDLTSKVRIRCAECHDFDLCVNCFAGGKEKGHHRSDHTYIPIGRRSFPLFLRDWSADEELMLLEGVSKYGLGNWQEVSELVAQHSYGRIKKKEACEKHYKEFYLNSPKRPLPDLSRLASFHAHLSYLAGSGGVQSKSLNDSEDADTSGQNESADLRDPNEFVESVTVSHSNKSRAAVQGSTKYPRPTNQSKPNNTSNIIGYMPLRGDFDSEHENEAELTIADMSFEESESPVLVELKLQILQTYCSRLDERAQRKQVLIGKDLLDGRRLQQAEKRRTKEQRETYNVLKPLTKFNCPRAGPTALVPDLLTRYAEEEILIQARLLKLQEWKSLGLRTIESVREYEENKKTFDEGFGQPMLTLSNDLGKGCRRTTQRTAPKSGVAEGSKEDTSAGCATGSASFPLCSDMEHSFCNAFGVPPVFLLVTKAVMAQERAKMSALRGRSESFSDSNNTVVQVGSQVRQRVYDHRVQMTISFPFAREVHAVTEDSQI